MLFLLAHEGRPFLEKVFLRVGWSGGPADQVAGHLQTQVGPWGHQRCVPFSQVSGNSFDM